MTAIIGMIGRLFDTPESRVLTSNSLLAPLTQELLLFQLIEEPLDTSQTS